MNELFEAFDTTGNSGTLPDFLKINRLASVERLSSGEIELQIREERE